MMKFRLKTPLDSDKILLLRSSKAFITFTISLAVFTDLFLYSVVVPILPFVLPTRLHVPQNQVDKHISVALSVYSAGLIFGSLVTGIIGDRLTQRKILMICGTVVMIGATLVSCLGRTIAAFDVGRVLQGLSGSFVWVIGLAILSDTAEKDELNFLMSFQSVAVVLSMLIGPLIGGVVFDKGGYYAVYGICFGILSVDIILRLLMVEKSDPRVVKLRTEASDSTQTPSTPAETADDEATLDVNETCPAPEPYIHPMIKLPLIPAFKLPGMILMLQKPRIILTVVQAISLSIVLSGFDTILSQHLHHIFHWSSEAIGLMFLALAAPAVLEPIVGKITDKVGGRIVLTGAYLWCVPFFALLIIPRTDTIKAKAVFATLAALIAFGMASMMAPILADLSLVIDEEEAKRPGIYGAKGGYAQAYGIFNVSYSVGALVSPMAIGALYNSKGWIPVMIMFAAMFAVMAIPTFLLTGGYIFASRPVGLHRNNLSNRNGSSTPVDQRCADE